MSEDSTSFPHNSKTNIHVPCGKKRFRGFGINHNASRDYFASTTLARNHPSEITATIRVPHLLKQSK